MYPSSSRLLKSPALPGLLVFALLLPSLGMFRLLGLDESLFAIVAKEAGLEGHWLPLAWDGQPFVDKPPLQLWLMGLGIKLFGTGEEAFRWPSALFAGITASYAFVFSRRSWGLWPAVFATAILSLSEHFILFGRVGNLDMGIAACCLASLVHADAALEWEAKKKGREAARQWWIAGAWIAAGLLIKLYVALMVLPGIALAIYFNSKGKGTWARAALGLGIPAFLSTAAFFLAFGLATGPEFWRWNFSVALGKRLQASPISHGGFWDWGLVSLSFYASVALWGLAFLWPLLPLGLSLSLKEARKDKRLRRRLLMMAGFALPYAFAFTFYTSPLINYVIPLLPPLAWACAAPLKRAFEGESRGRLALSLALFAGFLSGAAPSSSLLLPLLLSLLAPLCLALPSLPRPGLPAQAGLWAAGLAFALALALKSALYLFHPPNPNAALVQAVREHPPRAKAELLLLKGDHVTTRVLSYYASYKILALSVLPEKSPGPAMLWQEGREAHFLPALPKTDEAALKEALKLLDEDLRPGAARGQAEP